MKPTQLLIAMLTCAALSACTGMPPKPEQLAKVPHIEFGQPLPQGDDYVLHFPAGASLPVAAVIEGSLFERLDEANMHVTLKHDVFAYRQFVSFEGTNWKPSRTLIDIRMELRIPEQDGKRAGVVRVKIDDQTVEK